MRKPYWNTLQITTWAVLFVNNCRARPNKTKRITKQFLSGDKIFTARDYWIRRKQQGVADDLQASGWKLNRDENTGFLKCKG